MTAKQLYDNIASTRQETATEPYVAALENFLQVRFVDMADEYIDKFLTTLQSVNNAADAFNTDNAFGSSNVYRVDSGLAAANFVHGTKHVDWLATWRETKVCQSDNQFAPIQLIMSSLRATAANRAKHTSMVYSATGSTENRLDPDAYCKKCRHRHKNKEYFIQHPELKKGLQVKRKKRERTLQSLWI